MIECCVGWLKEARRVATRYEKLAAHYLGVLKLAMVQVRIHVAFPDTRWSPGAGSPPNNLANYL